VEYSEVGIYDDRAMSDRQEMEVSAEMVMIVDGRLCPTAQAEYNEVPTISEARLVKTEEDTGSHHYYTAVEKVVDDNNRI
jgi:hypothetical protein